MLAAALLGMAFGLVGSIPIAGPISALVLRRGLHRRYLSAVCVGCGCAVAEGIYAFLAFWGFASFLDRHSWLDPVSRALAMVILMVLGVSFLRYRVPSAQDLEARRQRGDSALRSLAVGFAITLINPTLIATWSATATTLFSTGFVMSAHDALPFAIGASVGIAGWFAILTWVHARYGERFETRLLERTVRVIGAALLGLSVWFAWRLLSVFL